MIFDHIAQLDTYQGVSPDIYAGLRYLSTLSPNIALGEYRVNDRVLALVTEYPTKVENEGRYEAHRYVVDIQFPIQGREGIEWSTLAGMKPVTDYDAAKDRTMYTNPDNKTAIVIGGGYFAIFWPNDAHNPQRAVSGATERIKKVTLKVSLR